MCCVVNMEVDGPETYLTKYRRCLASSTQAHAINDSCRWLCPSYRQGVTKMVELDLSDGVWVLDFERCV